jgi:hypothetical protein
VITLLVYWVAEEYAELLGEYVEHGRLPTRAQVRAELMAAWPMVSASYLPLLTLALTRLPGASAALAANRIGCGGRAVGLPRMVGGPCGPSARQAASGRHIRCRRSGCGDDRAQRMVIVHLH